MRIPKGFCAVLSAIIFFIGACSFEPAFNKGKFEKLDVAARAVKTAIKAGESYQQVSVRVQQLSNDIAVLKNKVSTQKEKGLLDSYADLLSCYRDGLVLWKYKLDFAFFDSELKGRIYVGQDVEPIVIRYRFPTESHLYEPTGQYWKSIPGNSVDIIWSNADTQLKNIENITNYD